MSSKVDRFAPQTEQPFRSKSGQKRAVTQVLLRNIGLYITVLPINISVPDPKKSIANSSRDLDLVQPEIPVLETFKNKFNKIQQVLATILDNDFSYLFLAADFRQNSFRQAGSATINS